MKRVIILSLTTIILTFFQVGSLQAAPSKPKEEKKPATTIKKPTSSKPAPKPKPKPEYVAYNASWDLLKKEDYPAAEKKLREALKVREKFAEAHNNLAFALRKQGEAKFEEALTHYNRATEIKPKMPEAYMYRGVLYVQMGDLDKAKAEHEKLKELKPSLATELAWVIENKKEKEPAQFFGVTSKL